MIQCLLAAVVIAQPQPAVDRALAIRGGAIVLPMKMASNGGNWPATMDVVFRSNAGSQRVTGLLAWREPRPTAVRTWGSEPVPATLRSIHPKDQMLDGRNKGVGPRLMLAVPIDGEGYLDIGGHRVELRWHDLPDAMPDLRLGRNRPLGPAPTLMATTATPGVLPLERWRWELLCAADGLAAPPLPEAGLDRLAVLHAVGPWRVLMHALAKADRGVAREVLERLTMRIQRGNESIADWVTDPNQLAMFVQGQAGDQHTKAHAALAWAEAIVPVTAWLETPLQRRMTLALANAHVQRQVVELAWARPNEIPVAVGVPGRTVVDEPMSRPDAADALALQVGSMTSLLRLAPLTVVAHPPGLALGPFLGPLTLHDARAASLQSPPPADRQTWAHIRRILGRWEILLDCGRPAGTPEALLPAGAMSLNALVGHDAVLVRLHVDGQEIPIVVHPAGWHCVRGQVTRLDVRTARRGTAWISRILLPERWTSSGFAVELIRTHAGDTAVETPVQGGTPWAPLPGPIRIDVSQWDDGIAPAQTHPTQ
jgi:hypothetical protein